MKAFILLHRHEIYGDVFKIQFFDRMIVITSNQDAIRVLILYFFYNFVHLYLSFSLISGNIDREKLSKVGSNS